MVEVAHPSRRANLWVGMASGYALAVCFGALAYASGEAGVVPHRAEFYALIAVKFATNTLALAALKWDFAVLETQAVNTFTDLLTMTAAVYLTGGPLSPLFGAYIILIAIVALLSNAGVTLMATVIAWAMHTTVTLLTFGGVLPPTAPPGSLGLPYYSGAQTTVYIAFAAFLLGVTGGFTSLLVRAHRRKTDRLEERTNELIRANAQRTMLLANITHELRTPIHGISGLADVLEAGIYGPVTDEQKQAFGSLRVAGTTLLKMVDDLLLLARAEAGAIKLTLSEVEIAPLLQTVTGSVNWMIGTKQLKLELEREPKTPDHVVTDRGKLSQILVNLLANAVKFTPEGGKIRLCVRPQAEGVAFEVTDTGVGIDEAAIARVFEPFEQADASDEREFGGAGLGLAIVKRLVNMIDGSISVESEVGSGTKFTVWIPLDLDNEDTGQVLLDVTGMVQLGGSP